MRWFLSNALTAFTSFIYGIVSIYLWAFFTLPFPAQPAPMSGAFDSEIDWEQLKPVRPPLDASLLGLTDKERDGLVGPVKQVRRGIPAQRSKRSRVQCNFNETVAYDITGKKVSEKSDLFACGTPDPVKDFYDERGNLVRRIWSDGRTKIWRTDIFKYDEKGRWTEYYRFDSQDNLVDKSTFEYETDSYGNWIRRYSSDRAHVECREILYYK